MLLVISARQCLIALILSRKADHTHASLERPKRTWPEKRVTKATGSAFNTAACVCIHAGTALVHGRPSRRQSGRRVRSAAALPSLQLPKGLAVSLQALINPMNHEKKQSTQIRGAGQ